jgi:membrane protease YdiL (CAAX protease family)
MQFDPPRRRDTMLLSIGFEGGLVVLAWLLGWLLGHPPLERIHASWRDAALGVAASFPLLLGLWLCVRWPIGPLRRIKQFSDEFIRPIFRPCTVFDLAIISLLAGLGEEMLFRGVIQGAIGGWLGDWAGVVIAAVLFGLLHLITPTYAVLATLCGLYFGLLVLLEDNLLVAIVPHGLYDFIALLYLAHHRVPVAELAKESPEP